MKISKTKKSYRVAIGARAFFTLALLVLAFQAKAQENLAEAIYNKQDKTFVIFEDDLPENRDFNAINQELTNKVLGILLRKGVFARMFIDENLSTTCGLPKCCSTVITVTKGTEKYLSVITRISPDIIQVKYCDYITPRE